MSCFLSIHYTLYVIMLNSLIYIFLAPVMIGTAMAYGDGIENLPIAAVISSLSIIAYLVNRFMFARIKSYLRFDNLALIEFFTFLFLGPIGVAFTYYVQSGEINSAVVLSGFPCGLYAIALTSLRNVKSFLLPKFLLCILLAPLMSVLIYFITFDHVKTLSTAILVPISIPIVLRSLALTDGSSVNRAFIMTIKVLIVYCLIFSMGWIL